MPSDLVRESRNVIRLVSTACVVAICAVGAYARPAAGEDNGLDVVTTCLHRNALSLFPDASSLESVVTWDTNRTAAEVAVREGSSMIVTYRTAKADDGVKVSAENHVEAPDASFGERQSRMVRQCFSEAGYDETMMN
jgi:hypothetical protein